MEVLSLRTFPNRENNRVDVLSSFLDNVLNYFLAL